MALINNATREITAKIVYYGPGLCGKTTNLKAIYDGLPLERKGKMISLATETDRTLFFDFLPIELGRIKDFRTRVQLYTVPGQVFYDATRKLVLQGVDGVVFVADSQVEMAQSNDESLENLRVNLAEKKISLDEIPLVLQYNKRDLPNIQSAEEMERRLNKWSRPSYEASALRGEGVNETFHGICKLVLGSLSNKFIAMEREAAGSHYRKVMAEPEKGEIDLDSVFKDRLPFSESTAAPVPEPEAARAMTLRALEEQLQEVEEAFPLANNQQPAVDAGTPAPIEEDFIAMTDLEEVAELHELVAEKDRVLEIFAPERATAAIPSEERPLEAKEPVMAPAAVAVPIAEPQPPLEEPLPQPEAEPLAAAYAESQLPSPRSPEIVVPVDLSSMNLEHTPDGVEVSFRIKLIFKKRTKDQG